MRPRFLFTLPLLLLAAADEPRRHSVAIDGLSYAPAALTIAVGDTVVWTNNDDRDHTVSIPSAGADSGNIRSGKSFRFTFKKPGKFTYGCKYHPRSKGTITVE